MKFHRYQIQNAIRFFIVGPVLCFMSCSNYSKHKNIELSNSLESIKGWDTGMKIIEAEGHSGRFVTYADSSQVYNYGFHLPLKDITPQHIYHINAKVWAKCTSLSSNSNLVISLQDGDKKVAYINTKVEDTADKTGEWFAVTASIDLPPSAIPENELYVFVMNESKDRVFFDDMEIEIVTEQ
jgi:hypothetical protein